MTSGRRHAAHRQGEPNGLPVQAEAAVGSAWTSRTVSNEDATVEPWQISLFALFLLLPFTLLVTFWPDRERLNRSGVPIERDWVPQVTHEPHDDEHH